MLSAFGVWGRQTSLYLNRRISQPLPVFTLPFPLANVAMHRAVRDDSDTGRSRNTVRALQSFPTSPV